MFDSAMNRAGRRHRFSSASEMPAAKCDIAAPHENVAPDPGTDIGSNAGDGTAVYLSAPGAVRHDVAHQVADFVLQISDDVLDDVSNRDHAHDLARVQHW